MLANTVTENKPRIDVITKFWFFSSAILSVRKPKLIVVKRM